MRRRLTRRLTPLGSPSGSPGDALDRYWLLTWTCYGHWLPGDARGFVGHVREPDGSHVSHNIPGPPYSKNLPRLEAWTREHMTGEPVTLTAADADALLAQYAETCRVKTWGLEAASVMFNHTHLVVGVPGDPEPDAIRETFKSWATRGLKKRRQLPPNGTFWTAKGMVRKLADERAVRAVVYVARKQPEPLAMVWAPHWQDAIDDYDR